MSTRSLYLAAYDISSPRRLRHALHVAKNYATGGQKSVFECFLSPTERNQLANEMLAQIDISQDRFLLLPVDRRANVITLGIAVPPVDPVFYYVGERA